MRHITFILSSQYFYTALLLKRNITFISFAALWGSYKRKHSFSYAGLVLKKLSIFQSRVEKDQLVIKLPISIGSLRPEQGWIISSRKEQENEFGF